MKKIFALVLVLALLCVSCAALATDSAFNPDNEDGVTIEAVPLYKFLLELESGKYGAAY